MSSQLHYTLLVTGPAYGTEQASSAYLFAQALLEQHHKIDTIFFYREGVYNANQLTSPASDEFHLVNAWKTLATRHHILLNVCVSAALRRGILDENAAQNQAGNLASTFRLSGLGELAKSLLTSDRVIQF